MNLDIYVEYTIHQLLFELSGYHLFVPFFFCFSNVYNKAAQLNGWSLVAGAILLGGDKVYRTIFFAKGSKFSWGKRGGYITNYEMYESLDIIANIFRRYSGQVRLRTGGKGLEGGKNVGWKANCIHFTDYFSSCSLRMTRNFFRNFFGYAMTNEFCRVDLSFCKSTRRW